MTFKFERRSYRLPVGLSDVTIQQCIDFDRAHGVAFRAQAAALDTELDTYDLSLTQITADAAVEAFSFFTAIDADKVKRGFDIAQILVYFNTTLAPMLSAPLAEMAPEVYFAGEVWHIAAPQLTAASAITFNEFLLSKEFSRQISQTGAGAVEALPYLCAIFLRKPGEPFTEALIAEGSERLEIMRSAPMNIGAGVAFFFEAFNTFVLENFSVFKKARGKQPNLSKHFDKWGWQSFLTFIAEAGVFTIPGSGMNAINCAKATPCYDVLSYASEKKDHEEIIAAWQESQ